MDPISILVIVIVLGALVALKVVVVALAGVFVGAWANAGLRRKRRPPELLPARRRLASGPPVPSARGREGE